MANKAENFGTIKNLREWLNIILDSEDIYLHRARKDASEEVCYNADLIWDGTNYHITYTNIDGTVNYVLPFTYTDEQVWSIHELCNNDESNAAPVPEEVEI